MSEMALKSAARLRLFSSAVLVSLRQRCFASIATTTPVTFLSSNEFAAYSSSAATVSKKKKKKQPEKLKKAEKIEAKSVASRAPEPKSNPSSLGLVNEKRRTRSDREFHEDAIQFGDTAAHIPVMLAEVLDVFSASRKKPLRSFVDCTVGAAGHSSAIMQAHPELEYYAGMDVDPVAYNKAQARIDTLLHGDSTSCNSDLKAYLFLKNFKHIKSILYETDHKIFDSGVDGILIDLGMSSMQVNNPERGFSVLGDGPLDMRMDPQASLKAEDILNSWPDAELGRILREYGEETNWHSLQKKIVKARSSGGLHSTGELVDLIKSSTPATKRGRQGWIKTATRVFQALRIAVNDELKTLQDSLYACFDCLSPGGRLAVISFHSLEDRVVKKTFLDIVGLRADGDANAIEEEAEKGREKIGSDLCADEAWIRQIVLGQWGTILTKRPITPSEEEEQLNSRSRSAKLRVIQKADR